MVAGKTQFAATVAAIALAGSAYAAPTREAEPLADRTNKPIRVTGQAKKDTLQHGKVVDAAHDKLKDTPGSKPHPSTPPRRVKDTLHEIIARAYYDEDAEELVARMEKVAKIVGQVVKDNLHTKVVDAVNDKIKDAFGSKPQPLSPQLQQALNQAKGPHHPSVIAAVVSHLPKSHKRRDFVVDAAHGELEDTFGSKPAPITPQQQAAIDRASGSHHPSTVISALHHLPKTPQSGHKKRYPKGDFYEIFARGFDLDDLE